MYSSSTFLLVQKPKNVKTNLMFKLFQITEKCPHPFACRKKKKGLSLGKTTLLLLLVEITATRITVTENMENVLVYDVTD